GESGPVSPAAEPIGTAIDELAAKQPEAAQAIVDHVAQADKPLAEDIQKRVDEAKKATPEKVGETSAEEVMSQPIEPDSAPTQVAAEGVSDAVKQGHQDLEQLLDEATKKVESVEQPAAAAEARPAVKSEPVATHTVESDTGLHKVTVPDGELLAQENG